MADVDLNAVPIDETPTSDGKVVVSQDTAGTPNLIRTSRLPGGVTVDDATLDGEPIAYDQTGARFGNLEIDSTAPYLRFHDNDGTTDQSTTRLVQGSKAFALATETDAGVRIQIMRVFPERNEVNFLLADAVKVPDPTGSEQAAQVTAVDATTGRLAIGGIEMGDTGWRDVSADMINGWTGTLLMRRTAQTVSFRGEITGDGTDVTSFSSPIGFRAGPFAGFWSFAASSSDTRPTGSLGIGFYGTTGAGLRCRTAETNGVLHYFGAAYTTVDSWPTTLPGTAV